MIVISSAELRGNMKKYLDLACSDHEIMIQRGRNETFVLSRREQPEYLEPDEDFHRAISAEELLKGVKEDIHEMFSRGKR